MLMKRPLKVFVNWGVARGWLEHVPEGRPPPEPRVFWRGFAILGAFGLGGIGFAVNGLIYPNSVDLQGLALDVIAGSLLVLGCTFVLWDCYLLFRYLRRHRSRA